MTLKEKRKGQRLKLEIGFMNSYDWGYGSARHLLCTDEEAHGSKNKGTMGGRSAFFLLALPFKCELSKHLWALSLHCNPLKTPTLRASGILADLLILVTIVGSTKILLNIVSACVSLNTQPPESADSGQTRCREPLKASNNKNTPTVRRVNCATCCSGSTCHPPPSPFLFFAVCVSALYDFSWG